VSQLTVFPEAAWQLTGDPPLILVSPVMSQRLAEVLVLLMAQLKPHLEKAQRKKTTTSAARQ
jgi:hypothetical protein